MKLNMESKIRTTEADIQEKLVDIRTKETDITTLIRMLGDESTTLTSERRALQEANNKLVALKGESCSKAVSESPDSHRGESQRLGE